MPLEPLLRLGEPRGGNPSGYEDTDEEATQRCHTTQHDVIEENFIKMKVFRENGRERRCSVEGDIFLVNGTYLLRHCYTATASLAVLAVGLVQAKI